MLSQYRSYRNETLERKNLCQNTDSYVLHAVTKYSCSTRKKLDASSNSIENEKTNQLLVHTSELFCCHAFISQKYLV